VTVTSPFSKPGEPAMKIGDILRTLDLGSSVAEFDQMIDRHFVMTNAYRGLIEGKADIVAGDKGAGKTTIYRYLQQEYTKIPQLRKVEVVSGFNPAGNPVFRRLIQPKPYTEGQYLSFWKAYFLSLVGNWFLKLSDGSYSPNSQKLDAMLDRGGLRTKDDSVETIFSRLSKMFQRFTSPKGASVEFSLNESGLPTLRPNVEFADSDFNEEDDELFDYDAALSLLNNVLDENDITVWILLDRLDEAFTGYPDIELPALRALLRTYLDVLAFDRIGLKLFVRKDLFRKIVRGGFVNLTHITARKIEIIWDREDLFALLCRRIKASDEFLYHLSLEKPTDEEVFAKVFSEKLSPRKLTWRWMLEQIKDGSGFVAPRNLVDLVNLAIEEQTRVESRTPREYRGDIPIIEFDALRRALLRLSKTRVEDTLLAEATNDVAVLIEGFRGRKVEQNSNTIAEIFGVLPSQAKEFAEVLINIGFFERRDENYRVPVLYRYGLAMKE
jgi:hypothetical protein